LDILFSLSRTLVLLSAMDHWDLEGQLSWT